jgi:hypothetical protein
MWTKAKGDAAGIKPELSAGTLVVDLSSLDAAPVVADAPGQTDRRRRPGQAPVGHHTGVTEMFASTDAAKKVTDPRSLAPFPDHLEGVALVTFEQRQPQIFANITRDRRSPMDKSN